MTAAIAVVVMTGTTVGLGYLLFRAGRIMIEGWRL